MGICCPSADLIDLTHDLDNEVKGEELKNIRDTNKKFVYMFPFYRMSIQALEKKLDKLYSDQHARCRNTDLVHLD